MQGILFYFSNFCIYYDYCGAYGWESKYRTITLGQRCEKYGIQNRYRPWSPIIWAPVLLQSWPTCHTCSVPAQMNVQFAPAKQNCAARSACFGWSGTEAAYNAQPMWSAVGMNVLDPGFGMGSMDSIQPVDQPYATHPVYETTWLDIPVLANI